MGRLIRNQHPVESRRVDEIATAGHIRFGDEWPTLDTEPDPLSVRADWDARARLLFDAVVYRRWSLPDVWGDD